MPGRAWAAAVVVAIGSVGPVSGQSSQESILGAPIAIRGEPVRADVPPFPPSPSASFSIPAGYLDPPAVQRPTRAAGLGIPVAITSAEMPSTEPAIDPRIRQAGAGGPPAVDPVNDFLTHRSDFKANDERHANDDRRDRRKTKANWTFGDRMDGMFGQRGAWFHSDHAFDGFISPVTNPFLFEDPRSLTELRPIFIYQKIPGSQVDFRGGNISYFGVQGRLAITDRLSFVINKLGGTWVNPGGDSIIPNQAGFSEIWFGPKYTFIRNEESGSLVAGGLQFQAPIGSQSAFQSNGTLSLVPYVSGAQNLFRDFAAGSVNVMGTTGYSFSTTSARSDYWYLSGHVDLDVLNCHHFYPLIEMNYFVNTRNGNTTNIGVEGRDLINFGGQASGKGLLTGAIGARYKITEAAQVGGAFEIPIAGPHDLFQYRFTLDFILRY
jgi:hypothetical protein